MHGLNFVFIIFFSIYLKFCFFFSLKGFSIEGPSQARIECNDNGDGSANVRYWPTIPGEYAVHILCNDEDIPLSPFMAWIESPGNFEPNKVKRKI
jgi:filamin